MDKQATANNENHGDAFLRERRIVSAIIGIFLLCISLPYLWAILITPPGWTYGGFLYNTDDPNVHLSWARQAYDGHFFFRDQFTHESLQNQPLFTNIFAWLIGFLGRITGIPLIVIYHVLRLIFSALTIWWFWQLCRELTSQPRLRVMAVAVAAFSGGAGWLSVIFKNRIFIDKPTSSWMMPEAWTFTSALIFPLMIISVFLLCVIYCQTLRAQRTGKWLSALGAGLAALILSNIHTYDVLPLNVVLILWAIASTRINFSLLQSDGATTPTTRLKAWQVPFIPILGSLPPLFYQLIVFRNSEEFRVKALTITAPPGIINILLSYSLLLLLGIIGVALLRRAQNSSEKTATPFHGVWLMVIWTIVTFCIIYAPLSFGRKMIEGVHIPISFLAALGLHQLTKNLSSASTRRALIAGAVAVLSISSVNFTLWCLNNAADNNRSRANVFMPPLYLPPSDVAALQYLNESDEARDKAVLCLTFLGNYVPRETGRTVFIGHWAETLYYNRKLGEVARFYGINPNQMNAEEARAWLKENNIGIVVVGFYEQGATLPLDLPLMQQFGDTRIYRVP